jgi:hypothetical protein
MVKAVVAGAAGEPVLFIPGIAIPSRPDHPLGPSRCAVAGGIGQPLSLLLKLNPIVTELSLYDVVNAPGVSLYSWL